MRNYDEQNETIQNLESVKVLRLWQMIFLGKGTLVRQFIHALISIALRLFFRRIEAVSVEKAPQNGAIIFVLNHPNGLVDPALVFVSLPRRVSFLAKSTLYANPIAGFLLRTFEILPIYRRSDALGDIAKNRSTFENCHELLGRGRCIAIFPEGISHDATKLQPIKTGAARIALGALAVGEDLKKNGLKIMAVGLYYTSKTAFRSEALIRYGELLDVEPVELDETGEPPRDAVLRLTDRIETALKNVTLNLETAGELETVVKAEALFSSVYENLLFKQTLTQTFQRLQNLAEKYKLLGQNEPEKMRRLNEKVTQYENNLKTSGVTTESLSVLQHPTAYVFRYLILRIVILILLAPLSIVGAIVHSPAYLFSNLLGLMVTRHGDDAAGSTSKILAAWIFMPLTWLIVAGAIFLFFSWQFALASIPLTILCGYVALRSFETLVDMRVWLNSAWLLLRQRALFLRLLVQRESLRQEIGEIIEK
ncbi:MAG: lysophospholipid acyltransferase family protein [Acidobacteriota bacterium]|nr:lysophospholipid acyltransferase family protein [Acidobacteriota bacterium]